MIPLRLLTFLFILSIASKLVTGLGTENQEQVPCEDETKTVPNTTTTTVVPTTTVKPCSIFPGTTAYRRQSGWWCTKMFYQDMQLGIPMTYEEGLALCTLNKLPYVSSFELDKEKTDYSWLAPRANVYAFWVNISFNTTKGEYEWGDEHSIPTIDPQPTVIDSNGKGVWTINRDSSVSGPGSLSIVQTSGTASTNVRGIMCGGPGLA